MGWNNFDVALRQSILKYLEAGHRYKMIARDFGISVYSAKHIRDLYQRGNLDYFNGVDKPTQYDDCEKLAIVHQFLESGQPLKTFAREVGLDRNTLRIWVRKYHEGPQPSVDDNHTGAQFDVCEKVAVVEKFLCSNQSMSAFASALGVNPYTFKNWVQMYSGEARQTSKGVSKKTRREDSEKLALVVAFLASGLPMTAFAKSEGISYSTFKKWVQKYRERTLKK